LIIAALHYYEREGRTWERAAVDIATWVEAGSGRSLKSTRNT
jgi:glutamine synthetase adenylyltransferase